MLTREEKLMDRSKKEELTMQKAAADSAGNQKISQNSKVLEQGSFWQLLLRLSLPAVVVILIMLIYNMADTYFIGQTGDPNKISAISICMPVFTILSGISTLFGNGGCTTISIALGEKDQSKISRITAFCGFGCLAIGLLEVVIVFCFAEPIVIFLGADADTLADAVTYLRVFSFAGPFVLFANTYGSVARADGEAASAMIANMAGSVSNIVLDALFILGFGWDVFGAALATVLGNVIACIIIVRVIATKKAFLMPRLRSLTLRADIVVPVLTLGLPMTFSTLLSSISNTISNRLMISHGSVCLAAQSVAGKLGMVITMLIMGVCMGLQPAISYNYGSKNQKRLFELLRQLILFTVVLGIGLTAVIYFSKDMLIAAFIDNEEIIAYGRIFVLASVMVGPVYGLYQACQTFLQATGKVAYAIFASLLDKGLIYIPVLYLMNMKFGAYGIAFAHAVTLVFCIITILFLTLRWSRKIQAKKA